jgi:hypothetical protein
VPLRRALAGYEVETAFERGWSMLKNGALLDAAEQGGFTVLVTTDSNLRYQQNLAIRRIAIVVLSTTSWPRIQRVADDVVRAIQQSTVGAYVEVAIP